MPNRIPTPGISTPAVRKSPSSQPAVKPVPTPKKSPTISNYPPDPTKVKGFSFGRKTE